MSRAALDVGAFTWRRIQRLYDADVTIHWQRCESESLECPQEVFIQLFHEVHDADFEVVVRAVDWGRVRWELEELSGIALRRVRVERAYQFALDEARDLATRYGVVDDRQEVIAHWRHAHTWIVPPVMVTGNVLGTNAGDELLVGFTRLGNLLGLLDRQELPETHKHLVWVGSGMERG